MRKDASLAFALAMGLGSSAVADAMLPRLSGIVVGPLKRVALFVDRNDAHAVSSVEEGGKIAGFRIVTIKADEVVLEGPSGTARLALEQDVSAVTWRATPPPVLTDLRAQTTKDGEAMGLLAIQRDRCARAGLLPGVAADSGEKMQRLIAAISNLPPREDAARSASPQFLASALGAGWEAAERRDTNSDLDVTACGKVDANWRTDAGRYGLL